MDNRELIATLINFDEDDTSTGFVGASGTEDRKYNHYIFEMLACNKSGHWDLQRLSNVLGELIYECTHDDDTILPVPGANYMLDKERAIKFMTEPLCRMPYKQSRMKRIVSRRKSIDDVDETVVIGVSSLIGYNGENKMFILTAEEWHLDSDGGMIPWMWTRRFEVGNDDMYENLQQLSGYDPDKHIPRLVDYFKQFIKIMLDV